MLIYPMFTRRYRLPRDVAGGSTLLPSRSFATRFAACWVVVIAVSGCTTPIAISPTTASQPKLASGQPVSLEQTYAFDGGPAAGVPLPAPSSQAVAVMDGGNGSLIGGTNAKRKAGAPDGNVVLNWQVFHFSKPPRPFSAT